MKLIWTIPIFTLDKWKKQVYTVFADSIKDELDYTNFKEKAQLACVVDTMCGIVGVVGNTNATDILIQGLEKLEYRGYDSAGIFVLGGAENHLVKAVGRMAELSAKTAGV